MTDRKPEIGDIVLYIPRPGQVRANQSKLAALVVMINTDGSLELEVHPWNSEHVWQSRVPQESERHASHCWRFKEVIVANNAGRYFAVSPAHVHRFVDGSSELEGDYVPSIETPKRVKNVTRETSDIKKAAPAG